jgi:transposase
LRAFCDSLTAEDEVAIEATCNTHAIVRLITPHVARVVVSNPQKTRAIAEAKVKTDKVDAAILAELLAADFLPSVWVADEATHALRRQVARRANIVRQRTRLKNQVQAILHRNLIPRCPEADLFGVKGRCWLSDQHLPADEELAVEALLRQIDFHAQGAADHRRRARTRRSGARRGPAADDDPRRRCDRRVVAGRRCW